ncbi:MAG: hypothetical protein HWN65_23125 [Candidatus Helarchaeota archaeon]|nr:hypothetical protein [Candidatus Helarchaeota archaeon]
MGQAHAIMYCAFCKQPIFARRDGYKRVQHINKPCGSRIFIMKVVILIMTG